MQPGRGRVILFLERFPPSPHPEEQEEEKQNKIPRAAMRWLLSHVPGQAVRSGGTKPGLQAALCPANHCKTDLY